MILSCKRPVNFKMLRILFCIFPVCYHMLCNGVDLYCAVMSNEDEGIDIDDHGAASLSPADNINGVSDDDFSDAGRCVRSSVLASEHSVMSHQ